MSKTVKKLVGSAALLAGAVLSFTGVGLLISGGLTAVGAALLASATKPQTPQASNDFGVEVHLSGDPIGVRKILYGEAWVAGYLRFRQSAGTENQNLYMVIVLAGHACDSVPEVQADRETLTLDGSGICTAPSKWAGLIQVTYHLGADNQTADSTLVSTFSEWTTEHRLRGLTYAIVKLVFDQENMNTPPQFRFRIRGRKVYDPRLDTTVGGSGSHRADDESTWEWSQNTQLCTRDFLSGVHINSKRIAGVGVAATRFNATNMIAEANICDENVALAGSPSLGNENRYTTDGVIDPRQGHRTNLRHFEVAMAGDVNFGDGAWRFYAGAYRTPTLSLTDDHFIGGMRHKVHTSEADRYDVVHGSFAAHAEDGTTIDYHPVELSGVTVGQERFWSLDMPLVSDLTDSAGVYDGGARCQRIGKLLLEREVAGKSIRCTTSLYGLRAVPGETIQITRASFGLTNQVMRVIDVQLRPQIQDDVVIPVVDLLLEAGASSLYTWTAEETYLADPTELLQNPYSRPIEPLGALPASFGSGKQGGGSDFVYTLNALSGGSGDTGEIRIEGTTLEHPDGTTVTLTDTDTELRTPYGDGSVKGRFFIMYTATDPDTRFATLSFNATESPELVCVRYNSADATWEAFDNANTAEAFTPASTDCLVAAVEAAAVSGGLTAITVMTGGIAGPTGPTGAAGSDGLDASNFAFTGTFSATDADTVAWSAGTLKDTEGNTYSITGSNTGNMTVPTYIYWDPNVSTTAFQTTTVPTNAVGSGRIMIAVAEDQPSEATFTVFGATPDPLLIAAQQIAAGSITANEIASIVTFTQELILGSLGKLHTLNKDSFADNTAGVYVGWDATESAYVFKVGDADNSLGWDGSLLEIIGDIRISSDQVQTFTPTWTGFSVVPVGSVSYADLGEIVIMFVTAALTGTSNANQMTWSAGVPAAIRPSGSSRQLVCPLRDNVGGSNVVDGLATILTTGGASFSRLSADIYNPNIFAASGPKGFNAGWSIVYAK